MFDAERKINEFLMQYCQMILSDVPEERITEQPVPGVNHPVWILGHLTTTAERALSLLGTDPSLPEDWRTRFAPGTRPEDIREHPPKSDLIALLHAKYDQLRTRAAAVEADVLAKPNPNERMRAGLPTLGDLLAFILTGHVGIHLGQLSSWRRMIGLPPMF